MEVEFDVQMTSADLYDYMLHHTYTSASGLIGSVAGALMVVAGASGGGILCLIAGIIVLLYLPVTLFLKSKQQFLSNPSFKKPLHFKMTEEGIEVSQEDTTQVCPWEQIYKVTSTKSSIVVYTSRVNAFLFARKDMGELTNEVIRTISTHVSPNQVKIRW